MMYYLTLIPGEDMDFTAILIDAIKKKRIEADYKKAYAYVANLLGVQALSRDQELLIKKILNDFEYGLIDK